MIERIFFLAKQDGNGWNLRQKTMKAANPSANVLFYKIINTFSKLMEIVMLC